MNMKLAALIAGLVPSPALLLRLLLLLVVAAAAASGASLLPSCPSKCGAVDIPYPFGIGDSCSMEGFVLSCNQTTRGEMAPFWFNVEIVNISLPLGQIRMLTYISWQCYNVANNSVDQSSAYLNLGGSPFRFSDKLNKFTVIGCNTLAYIYDYQLDDNQYMSGCVSMCEDEQSIVNGTCSGRGCCQTTIPKNLKYYRVWFPSTFNTSSIWTWSRCSFALLLEANWFQFQTNYTTTLQFWDKNNGSVPVMVDWTIGNQTCEAAKRNLTSYACRSRSSVCIDSSNGPGYLCNCSDGYQGNPYLQDGCSDIDECTDRSHRCPEGAICQNQPGNYTCICPGGTHDDPYQRKCTSDQKLPLAVRVVIGTSSGLLFVIFCSMCICIIMERRKRINDRERYFRDHGGRLLLEEMKEKQGIAFKIFTKEELERATDKFNQNRIVGGGGYGTVYKGVLQNKRIVAIKKSKIINENQTKEFGKEMLILSQINHKNIVKLLGCCLEVEVPILVYEFIPNGTLFHLIHNRINASHISLATRLRIAYESADALAYLHLSASPPIIHGDVKTANILLDENYNAKVSDFGASKLIPRDEDQLATLVQGTCGYLDPEYFQTCRLTDKSDVYSFGVVLLEILTGRKAIYFEGSEEEEGRSLALYFFLAVKENRFSDILDSRVRDEVDIEIIQELCELIRRCLDLKGDERPTMKEVVEELERIRKFQQHPWLPQNSEEIISLLEEPSADHGAGANHHRMDTTAAYALEEGYALNIESGR